MKSHEFINEGDDKSIEDVQANHPDIYAFLNGVVGSMALKQLAVVEAYNTANSHMVRVAIKPSAGIENTERALQSAGMSYEAMKNPMDGGKVLSGSIGEMHWTVSDDNRPGNVTELWLFALPHKDNETQYYTDRTLESEQVDEEATPENNFRKAFSSAKLPLQSIEVDMGDDGWDNITAKGVKLFRRGVQEKLQFRVECFWNSEHGEASGTVWSQKNHMDKHYSQKLDLEDDRYTLQEFVAKVNEFVSGLANAEAEQYNKGEREYWAKGGRGMMPGAVKKDYR